MYFSCLQPCRFQLANRQHLFWPAFPTSLFRPHNPLRQSILFSKAYRPQHPRPGRLRLPPTRRFWCTKPLSDVFLRYQNYPFGLVLLNLCKACSGTDEFSMQTGSVRLRRERNSTSMLSNLKKEVPEEPDPLDDGYAGVVPYDPGCLNIDRPPRDANGALDQHRGGWWRPVLVVS
jgi:hypothetical protein